MKCNSYGKNLRNVSNLLKVKAKDASPDASLTTQKKINKEIYEFLLYLLKQYTKSTSEYRTVLISSKQRDLLNDSNQFYLWMLSALKQIKGKMCVRNREELEEAVKEKEVASEGYLKKTKSCNLTNGIRSTLKVIQDMEDERVKSKVNKYEVEINKLLEENQQLKKRLEDCNHPYTTSIVRRALKLHNYIAEKCNSPLITDNDGPWEIVDSFTKQARTYIRMTEKNLSLIHICRCRRYAVCRSRWSPYH
eukprot:TRINITY_DN14423_c0_g3_i1.p1 TRINITY_DN14423_c0_g3~~TRINITY_DN14423_c0_g3_i1.p1  ORF type:complete len:249 (+),score=63.16 TRINITY_DN14423_c0_g3_i1:107-853(+)